MMYYNQGIIGMLKVQLCMQLQVQQKCNCLPVCVPKIRKETYI